MKLDLNNNRLVLEIFLSLQYYNSYAQKRDLDYVTIFPCTEYFLHSKYKSCFIHIYCNSVKSVVFSSNLFFLSTDIDECQVEGTCSQFCENTVPGYKCSCVDGYRLGTDQRMCKATGFFFFIFNFFLCVWKKANKYA